MSTRAQTLWDPKQDKYVGLKSTMERYQKKTGCIATEAVVVLLVGSRTHWKFPIGYFLDDKMSGNTS